MTNPRDRIEADLIRPLRFSGATAPAGFGTAYCYQVG